MTVKNILIEVESDIIAVMKLFRNRLIVGVSLFFLPTTSSGQTHPASDPFGKLRINSTVIRHAVSSRAT